MTVEELISELQKVQDKTKPVYVYNTNTSEKQVLKDVEELYDRIDLNFAGDY